MQVVHGTLGLTAWDYLGRQGPCADSVYRQHLALQRVPEADAWLTAQPSEDGRRMESDLFRIAVARFLRLRVFQADFWCPLRGEVMDAFGDHALISLSLSRRLDCPPQQIEGHHVEGDASSRHGHHPRKG